MITYIEQTADSDLEYYFSSKFNMDYLDFLPSYPDKFIRDSISSWDELETKVKTDHIFAAESDLDKIYIINFGTLEINKKVVNYLEQLNSDGLDMFLYSTGKPKLLSNEKKVFTGVGFGLETATKITKNQINPILIKYKQQLELVVNDSLISEISNEVASIKEGIDRIDFLSLSNNPQQVWKEIKQVEKKQPFMLRFDVKNKKTIREWLQFDNRDEVQLLLSLIFTKLQKLPQSTTTKSALNEVVLTDQRIKNDSTTDPQTWYKYMLWKIMNLT